MLVITTDNRKAPIMSENDTPMSDESNAETSTPVNDSVEPTSLRSKWVMPGAAIVGAALVSGLLGFAIGNHGSADFGPSAESGQMFHRHGDGGQGLPGMEGDRDGGMNRNGEDNDNGRAKNEMPGQPEPGMPGMLPGGPQGSPNPIPNQSNSTPIQ